MNSNEKPTDTNMKHIFHLVGFSHTHVEAWIKSREIDDNYNIWSEDTLNTKKLEFEADYRMAKMIGMNRLGTFSSLEKAQEYIKLHPSPVSDHRYSTLLIEKHTIDDIDAACFGDVDFETWYGIEEEWGDNGWIVGVQYHIIDRPDCFRQTAAFA